MVTHEQRLKDPFYASIIDPLVQRRKELGLSQVALSDLIGVDEGQVAKWETLNRRPNGFSLLCWCDALEMDIEVKPAL